MRHTCPDGTQTKVTRDPKAPVGVLARHTCPNCGWTKSGEAILAATKSILGSSAVRASLR